MEQEGVAAARDLLYDPVTLNGLVRRLGSRPAQQRPQGEMRWRKAGEIVFPKRQRFPSSSVQDNAPKCSQVKCVKVPPGDW